MTPVSLPQKPNEQIKEAKGHDIEKWAPDYKVSNMLQGKSRGKLVIALETIKWLEQSRNNTRLWICLVVKVKSDAVKNNTA